jgi:hypothetical protein
LVAGTVSKLEDLGDDPDAAPGLVIPRKDKAGAYTYIALPPGVVVDVRLPVIKKTVVSLISDHCFSPMGLFSTS